MIDFSRPIRGPLLLGISLIGLPALVIPNIIGTGLAVIGLFLSLALLVSSVDGSAKGDTRSSVVNGVGLGIAFASLFANVVYREDSFSFFFYLGVLLIAVAYGLERAERRAQTKVPDRPPLDDVI